MRRRATGQPIDDVPGVVYRDARGQVVSGPPAAPVADMNGLPIPDYDDFLAARERSDIGVTGQPLILALESSRGCWWGAKNHCVFCGLNANGMGYRQKSYERFRDEVSTIAQRYKPRSLFMSDNILSAGYYKDFVEFDEKYMRPSEVDVLLGDPSKANKVLGWKPEVSFQGLVKMMLDHDLELARREKFAQGYRA